VAEAPTHGEQAAVGGCPRGQQWQVHKFGGTCVSAAERILRVAQLAVEASATSQQACLKCS
jgi:aspartokinase